MRELFCEPAEVEVEWKLLQTEFANAANPKGVLQGAAEDLPEGDEIITRRYEFYKFTHVQRQRSGISSRIDFIRRNSLWGDT